MLQRIGVEGRRVMCSCWHVVSNVDILEGNQHTEEWLWSFCHCTSMPGGAQHCVPCLTMFLSFFSIMDGTMCVQGIGVVFIVSMHSQSSFACVNINHSGFTKHYSKVMSSTVFFFPHFHLSVIYIERD